MPPHSCVFTALLPLAWRNALHYLGHMTAFIFYVLMWPTLGLGPTAISIPQANQPLTGSHGTIVGMIIPLVLAATSIGFITRAVRNAREGSSPIGAVLGAIMTASVVIILPSLPPAN